MNRSNHLRIAVDMDEVIADTVCGASVIRADYMIDDNPHNLEVFNGQKILYTAHHNIGIQDRDSVRVSSWHDIFDFFLMEADNDLESAELYPSQQSLKPDLNPK